MYQPACIDGTRCNSVHHESQALRIVLEAAAEPGDHGGIEPYVLGLLNGLGKLTGGSEEYVVVTPWRSPNWPSAYLGANQRIVSTRKPQIGPTERFKSALGPLRKLMGRFYRAALGHNGSVSLNPALPRTETSDVFWEELGGDLLHITYPLHFVEAKMPTVFTLHDLQHRHLPEFFSSGHLAWREAVYPVALRHSRAVVTVSHWVKKDIIRQYGVESEKIYVIPNAPGTETYAPVDAATREATAVKFGLPESFMLYPALTYQHKNHVRLLEAIALLRDRDGLRLNLICTGKQSLHWPLIKKRLHELDLSKQVRFLGFVSAQQLRAIFHLAQFLVFPSLFEGAGIPLIEAFLEGVPAACSDIPPFREYGGDATLFFDPQSVENIAEALRRMALETELRRDLRERGLRRSHLYSWEASAKKYRAVYRKVGGAPLSAEDEGLLAECTS